MSDTIHLFFTNPILSKYGLHKNFVVLTLDNELLSHGENTALLNLQESSCVYEVFSNSQKVESGKTGLSEILTGFRLKDPRYLSLSPAFLTLAKPKKFITYTTVVQSPDQILFLSSKRPTSRFPTSIADELSAAYDNYSPYKNPLNSHDAYYHKFTPKYEIERKFTLPAKADIWQLAAFFHEQVLGNDLPGFIPQFQDNFNKWEFNNYLYEVTAPPKSKGYISFIETPENKYFLKQKIFSMDQLSRLEIRTPNIVLDTSFDAYLKQNFPDLTFKFLPPFRRKRYDANIESLDTGNIYSIMFDHCWLIDAPHMQLVQCEIEYLKTRSATPIRGVIPELTKINAYVRNKFRQLNIPAKSTYYSKLTFLKDCQGHSVTVQSGK